MSQSHRRPVMWILAPDPEANAKLVTRQLSCDACTEDTCQRGWEPEEGLHHSPRAEDFAEALDWVYRHLREHPEHRTYAETITRPCRATQI